MPSRGRNRVLHPLYTVRNGFVTILHDTNGYPVIHGDVIRGFSTGRLYEVCYDEEQKKIQVARLPEGLSSGLSHGIVFKGTLVDGRNIKTRTPLSVQDRILSIARKPVPFSIWSRFSDLKRFAACQYRWEAAPRPVNA